MELDMTEAIDKATADAIDLSSVTDVQARALQFDPDLLARSAGECIVLRVAVSTLEGLGAASTHPLASPAGSFARCVKPDVLHISIQQTDGTAMSGVTKVQANDIQIRRLTRLVTGDGSNAFHQRLNVDGTEYLSLIHI